jgi:S1-C subfamily serine protease
LAAAIAPARPGWLGVGLIPHRNGEESWVTVQVIAPGGPAERGGLRVGDIVTDLDGKPFRFRSDLEMLEQLSKIRPGQRVRMRIVRAQQKMTVSVTAAPMGDTAYERWLENLEHARAAAVRQKPAP